MFTALLLFLILFWSYECDIHNFAVFEFILVMWIWYSQLCCCFSWFYFGHVNPIFTALLLFLILFWSCESDIHSFAVVLIFFWPCESDIHSSAVVFYFILVMWIWYSQFCCCFWFYFGHKNLIFTALLLFLIKIILVMWIWYSKFCCCFDFILVMWIWYSQLCCCFWFYFGHVNLISTALLLFLIYIFIMWVLYHNFAVVFNFHLVSESDILSFAVF